MSKNPPTKNRRNKNLSNRASCVTTERGMMKRPREGKLKRTLAIAAAMVFIFIFVFAAGLAMAQDDDGPTSSVRFVVVRDSDGKPVRNAEVVLHPVKRKGKQAKSEMELKTDAEGRTNIDGIPYGPLRVQVLALHF